MFVIVKPFHPSLMLMIKATQPSQLGHLKDAPLEAKVQRLPTNIRLGWKGLPRTNTSLLRKSASTNVKSFIVQAPGANDIKLLCTVIPHSYIHSVFLNNIMNVNTVQWSIIKQCPTIMVIYHDISTLGIIRLKLL